MGHGAKGEGRRAKGGMCMRASEGDDSTPPLLRALVAWAVPPPLIDRPIGMSTWHAPTGLLIDRKRSEPVGSRRQGHVPSPVSAPVPPELANWDLWRHRSRSHGPISNLRWGRFGACLLLSSACASFFRARLLRWWRTRLRSAPVHRSTGTRASNHPMTLLHFVLDRFKDFAPTPFMAHF